MKSLIHANDEINRLMGLMIQIRNVCRDNAPEACNHRLALDFVHQLTAAAIPPADGRTAAGGAT